jgi:hypothetical protein
LQHRVRDRHEAPRLLLLLGADLALGRPGKQGPRRRLREIVSSDISWFASDDTKLKRNGEATLDTKLFMQFR